MCSGKGKNNKQVGFAAAPQNEGLFRFEAKPAFFGKYFLVAYLDKINKFHNFKVVY
jgi:hypothetical protein